MVFVSKIMYRCDQLWLTCCALHSLLLNVDGLDDDWGNGVPSYWEDINNQYDMRVKKNKIPFVISKLNKGFNPAFVDSSEHSLVTAANATVCSWLLVLYSFYTFKSYSQLRHQICSWDHLFYSMKEEQLPSIVLLQVFTIFFYCACSYWSYMSQICRC